MKVAALCLAVLAAALAARVEPAQACSCALGDPRAALARADAAFVGTLLERREPPSLRSSTVTVTLVFRVERAVKGRLGRTVEVRTAAGGASCGIELEVGQRIGLLLDRDGAGWNGTLCGQVAPARLLEAARPLPAPDGRGPVVLVAGGAFGPARTIALDRLGRTLAYGRGVGETQLLAVCPGARRVAEVVMVASGWRVAVRELPTLRPVWSSRLSLGQATPPSAAGCADRAGRTVDVFATSLDAPVRAQLVRVRAGSARTAWRGSGIAAGFSSGVWYVNRGVRGQEAAALDPATGRTRRIARIPAWTGALVPSPDGRSLAGVAYSSPLRPTSPASRLVLVDRRSGRLRSASLGSANVSGDVAWLPGGRLAFFPSVELAEARVYDRSLRLLARVRPWRARTGVAVGTTAYGVGWQGELSRALLPSGPVRSLRTLPSPVVRALVAVR